MQTSDNGIIYSSLKHFKIQEMFQHTPKDSYIILLRFRTCNNRLRIKTARWGRGTAFLDSTCRLCYSGDTG
jgi:hypothetical protein